MTNKFSVGDKVKIIGHTERCKNNVGDVGEIVEVARGYERARVQVEGGPTVDTYTEFHHLKLVESKPTKNQRISKLEEEVAELKVIVAQIRKPSTEVSEALSATVEDIIGFEGKPYQKVDREAREGDVVFFRKSSVEWVNKYTPRLILEGLSFIDDDGWALDMYNKINGRTPETVDVYELIVEDEPFFSIPEPKTPNQLRAEIIEKAKGFNESFHGIKYFVNEDKRTVVALSLRNSEGKVKSRGIAKCHPSDVFNADIGLTIAIGRLYGLDVSEFEQAVQPNEVVVGMTVKYNEHGRIAKVVDLFYGEIDMDKETYLSTAKGYGVSIINDTNAQYLSEVVE